MSAICSLMECISLEFLYENGAKLPLRLYWTLFPPLLRPACPGGYPIKKRCHEGQASSKSWATIGFDVIIEAGEAADR